MMSGSYSCRSAQAECLGATPLSRLHEPNSLLLLATILRNILSSCLKPVLTARPSLEPRPHSSGGFSPAHQAAHQASSKAHCCLMLAAGEQGAAAAGLPHGPPRPPSPTLHSPVTRQAAATTHSWTLCCLLQQLSMADTADIAALVRRLRGRSRTAQLQALVDLRALMVRSPALQAAFVVAGGIPACFELVQGGPPAIQYKALMALSAAVVDNGGTSRALVQAGLSPLVLLLQTPGGDQTVQGGAATLLYALLQGECAPDVSRLLMAAGALPAIAALLQRSRDCEAASGVLVLLAKHSQEAADSLASVGAIQTMVRLLLETQGGTRDHLLACLAQALPLSAACVSAFAACGGISAMMQCAGRDAADSTRAGAATVLFTAASQHPHLVPAVLDVGILQLLQQLEHSPSPTARAMAVAGREYFLLEQQARSAPQTADPAAAAGTAPQRQQSGHRRVCGAPD